MASHSSILAWKSYGQRSLVGCSPWGRRELGTNERLTLARSQLGMKDLVGLTEGRKYLCTHHLP